MISNYADERTFIATEGNTSVDVTDWDRWYMWLTPVEGFSGTRSSTSFVTFCPAGSRPRPNFSGEACAPHRLYLTSAA